MNPYFDTSHLAGALLLVPVLAWGVMEASHLDNSREGATKVGGAGRRMAAWPFLIAASAVLYLAPHLVPAAAIRPGTVAFAIGLVILLTGLVLRGWSILTLGAYFTASVKVKSGPAFRAMNRCPSSSQVTDITWSPLRWTAITFDRGKIEM